MNPLLRRLETTVRTLDGETNSNFRLVVLCLVMLCLVFGLVLYGGYRYLRCRRRAGGSTGPDSDPPPMTLGATYRRHLGQSTASIIELPPGTPLPASPLSYPGNTFTYPSNNTTYPSSNAPPKNDRRIDH